MRTKERVAPLLPEDWKVWQTRWNPTEAPAGPGGPLSGCVRVIARESETYELLFSAPGLSIGHLFTAQYGRLKDPAGKPQAPVFPHGFKFDEEATRRSYSADRHAGLVVDPVHRHDHVLALDTESHRLVRWNVSKGRSGAEWSLPFRAEPESELVAGKSAAGRRVLFVSLPSAGQVIRLEPPVEDEPLRYDVVVAPGAEVAVGGARVAAGASPGVRVRRPRGLCFGGGHLFVADAEARAVYAVDPDGGEPVLAHGGHASSICPRSVALLSRPHRVRPGELQENHVLVASAEDGLVVATDWDDTTADPIVLLSGRDVPEDAVFEDYVEPHAAFAARPLLVRVASANVVFVVGACDGGDLLLSVLVPNTLLGEMGSSKMSKSLQDLT